jgi:hypothetical protein
METIISFIDKNLFFIVGIFLVLLISLLFLIFTYDRSFRVHQQRLDQVLSQNATNPLLFISRIHVGHDGTTVWFASAHLEMEKKIEKSKKKEDDESL